MSDGRTNEGRLSRWSQRKRAAAREEIAEQQSDEALTLDAERQAELCANRDAAEAVDLDTLDKDSDFSVFMKDGVPEMLKRKAMASLWRTSPVFANVDGLVDYDDDFGSPDLIMKTFKSAYQAGKGYLDLFPEEQKTAEAESVDTTDEEKPEPAAADVHDDDIIECDEVDEPEDVSKSDVVVEENTGDSASQRPEPFPGISLRKRLELDRSS